MPTPPQTIDYAVDCAIKLTVMLSIFKPLFVYKKYLVAHSVLKEACKSFVLVTNSDNEPNLLSEKNFGQMYLSNLLLSKEPVDTVRLIEAVELLESKKHIIAHRNFNLYKYSVEITKAGERAFNDGYYIKKIYRWLAIIIGSPIILFLLSQIPKLI